MTIQEMHVQFDQGVQAVASNRSRAFFPEEKDLIFNKMINRYIISRIRPKPDGYFEVDSMAQEQLSTLMKRGKAFVENKTCILPFDLGWHLAAGVGLSKCGQDKVKTEVRYKHTLVFPQTERTTASFYQTAVLGPASLVTIAEKNGVTWNGFSYKAKVTFEVLPFLIQELRKQGLDATLLNDNEVEIITTSATPLTAQVDDGPVVTSSVTTISYSTTIPGDNFTVVPVRLVPSASLFDFEAHPYLKGSVKSVVGHFTQSAYKRAILINPGNYSYIVNGCELFYIAKPQRVSLSLGLGCNINELYHDEIVDLAIAYAKVELGTPDWEQKLADLMRGTTALTP